MLKFQFFTSKLTEIDKLCTKIEFIRQEGQMNGENFCYPKFVFF